MTYIKKAHKQEFAKVLSPKVSYEKFAKVIFCYSASMFQNVISQITKCGVKDGFCRDSHIYVQGKIISSKSCIHKNIIPWN